MVLPSPQAQQSHVAQPDPQLDRVAVAGALDLAMDLTRALRREAEKAAADVIGGHLDPGPRSGSPAGELDLGGQTTVAVDVETRIGRKETIQEADVGDTALDPDQPLQGRQTGRGRGGAEQGGRGEPGLWDTEFRHQRAAPGGAALPRAHAHPSAREVEPTRRQVGLRDRQAEFEFTDHRLLQDAPRNPFPGEVECPLGDPVRVVQMSGEPRAARGEAQRQTSRQGVGQHGHVRHDGVIQLEAYPRSAGRRAQVDGRAGRGQPEGLAADEHRAIRPAPGLHVVQGQLEARLQATMTPITLITPTNPMRRIVRQDGGPDLARARHHIRRGPSLIARGIQLHRQAG
ncbi:hypothetical protein [Thiocystis violacea]|uniref:hypothetical protein n=1 Tax=Thiocystis violacea TaxID=13725 RepID=UPI001908BE48|nr:hypothetical protein [Thiocystis violacea]MBK1725193.1 hypothetical protein [Thiocystis violacea]